jgi:hypothetical protein
MDQGNISNVPSSFPLLNRVGKVASFLLTRLVNSLVTFMCSVKESLSVAQNPNCRHRGVSEQLPLCRQATVVPTKAWDLTI